LLLSVQNGFKGLSAVEVAVVSHVVYQALNRTLNVSDCHDEYLIFLNFNFVSLLPVRWFRILELLSVTFSGKIETRQNGFC
jgi:hypothetical protein